MDRKGQKLEPCPCKELEEKKEDLMQSMLSGSRIVIAVGEVVTRKEHKEAPNALIKSCFLIWMPVTWE